MDLREANNVPGLFRVKDHWYYAAKYAFVRKLIGNTTHKLLLDVGAGSGLFGRAALDDRIAGKTKESSGIRYSLFLSSLGFFSSTHASSISLGFPNTN